MIIVHCPRCVQNYRMLADDSLVGTRSSFWPDKYTCPVCESQAFGVHEGEAYTEVPTRDINSTEMYAAMHGLGLPGEVPCDSAAVRDFFSQPIEKVVGFDVPGTTRFIIEQIVLKNGTRLYLGASPHGAVVYRIARKHDYAKALLEKIDE